MTQGVFLFYDNNSYFEKKSILFMLIKYTWNKN